MDINGLILGAIESYVPNYMEEKLKNSNLMEKRTAIVKEVLSNNKYKLELGDNTFTVSSPFTFAVNEVVSILTRYGQIKDVYILPKG